jgi:hypothetical protein
MTLAHKLHSALKLPDNVTRFVIYVDFQTKSQPTAYIEYRQGLHENDDILLTTSKFDSNKER